ncbi:MULTISPECIES: MFS transporter [unclassified Campylobacter]|uniref:MFS transporter n=1 Tax=unclassified Campylobacter TaxID=2593542 RepID=UPI001237EAB0|nr:MULTISPECIES: MFS transporter [unclassified Campylobacter]KAA6224931.1 MFS transporter [Campylobacter sp. LR286c]KAA6228404.1 MFS transporter [Campylobacter sp. LR185c]KAA6228890.1 MFS transporter [Campylobacter sp. LR196d]KAA6229844.1 MFS transporter [Campylobacter sp. LR264d]KAA6234055.1 MFS transporter [Campylobacter sp. LR291e]
MLKNIFILSFIVATRFFGLFIVLPVLSLYALNLKGANDFLIGMLVGIYALTQMLLQTPFGMLSDKIGRKKTMLFGLLIFIIGSLVCSFASDIYMMIFGRLLQGSGAIGAVATAMISDFVPEEKRGKAMAIMGSFIGISFATSMLIAPIMSAKFGLSSLFDLSAILSFLCIILLFAFLPKETKIIHHNEKTPLLHLFKDKNLALMNLTNFMQKMLMSLAFLSIPIVLVKGFGIFKEDELYKVYILAMLAGFFAMGLAGSLGEKRGLSKQILILGVLFFILSYVLFVVCLLANFSLSIANGVFIVAVVIFFIGFNLHEPIMQSCASKFCKVNEKGVALGIFNSFGYCGSFIGGLLGGLFFNNFDILCIILAFFSIIWLILLCFLKNPSEFKNLYLSLDTKLNLNNQILGIVDIYKNTKYLVIKFDSKIINEISLKEMLKI